MKVIILNEAGPVVNLPCMEIEKSTLTGTFHSFIVKIILNPLQQLNCKFLMSNLSKLISFTAWISFSIIYLILLNFHLFEILLNYK